MALYSFRENDNLSSLPPDKITRQLQLHQRAAQETTSSGKKNKIRTRANGAVNRLAIRIGEKMFSLLLESEYKWLMIAIIILVCSFITLWLYMWKTL